MMRTTNDQLMKTKLMEMICNDLRTMYDFHGSNDEVLQKYASMSSKPKLDWRGYDKAVDPSRKCIRPFTYKLFMDVIKVHLLPQWNGTELKEIDMKMIERMHIYAGLLQVATSQ